MSWFGRELPGSAGLMTQNTTLAPPRVHREIRHLFMSAKRQLSTASLKHKGPQFVAERRQATFTTDVSHSCRREDDPVGVSYRPRYGSSVHQNIGCVKVPRFLPRRRDAEPERLV